ncbi:MAG: 50S ribosomal protein L23 [Candidatus Kaiserbacteria bacterium]|nr:50S ribosomal protein L23 [Candidatus Kaiserbacteria bacterium]
MIFPTLFKKGDDDKEDAKGAVPVSVKPVRAKRSSSMRRTRRLSHIHRSYQKQEGIPAADRLSSYRILSRPVVTEKAADLSEKGVYTFLVHDRADKFSVAQAVEAVYGVRPRSVRIARRPSRRKQVRTQNQRQQRYGFTASRKKAYVVLKPGDTISLV